MIEANAGPRNHNQPMSSPSPSFCSPPNVLWLQFRGDGDPCDESPIDDADVTWCRDKIFGADEMYIRAERTTGSGSCASPCSALDAAWKSINPILRGAMDYADFCAGWDACARHIQENESIQIVGRPRCDYEFEAELVFESFEQSAQGEAQPPENQKR